MTDQALTDALVFRVLGWTVTPDRYVKSSRAWLPKWRFQPLARVQDAIHLLEATGATFEIASSGPTTFQVLVTIGARSGKATGKVLPYAISMSVAAAVGLLPGGKQR